MLKTQYKEIKVPNIQFSLILGHFSCFNGKLVVNYDKKSKEREGRICSKVPGYSKALAYMVPGRLQFRFIGRLVEIEKTPNIKTHRHHTMHT